ncbi:MAG: hypothetical protein IKV41_07180 [Oscillospiraceae bacterium]|nr:hypothetical protein [Oscillospiraceae bacterium]
MGIIYNPYDGYHEFVIDEQSAVNKSEYKIFLIKNLDNIDSSLHEDFVYRYYLKPISPSDKKELLDYTYDSENSCGTALFHIKGEEYSMVKFTVTDGKISEYAVRILYGNLKE